jgi:hypothetical protein
VGRYGWEQRTTGDRQNQDEKHNENATHGGIINQSAMVEYFQG